MPGVLPILTPAGIFNDNSHVMKTLNTLKSPKDNKNYIMLGFIWVNKNKGDNKNTTNF